MHYMKPLHATCYVYPGILIGWGYVMSYMHPFCTIFLSLFFPHHFLELYMQPEYIN